MSLSFGRDLLAIPGPSVTPDRVLRAMHRAPPNIYEGELIALTERVIADLKRVARTEHSVAIYIGNGHAGWEAALANVLAPGDFALVIATGRFGLGWAEMARRMGVEVEVMDFGFRAPADPERVEARLRADGGRRIKAVLTVQTDTASSVRNDVPALRAAIDAAGHPALLMVDCIACLGCDVFEMDAWGVDVMVAACQKGLMTPPGVAFTWHGPKAEAARVDPRSSYWDWGPRIRPDAYYKLFCGTAPTHHLYGLREALAMILDEEGLERTWARHATFAGAVWAAVEAWGAGGALALNIADPRDALACRHHHPHRRGRRCGPPAPLVRRRRGPHPRGRPRGRARTRRRAVPHRPHGPSQPAHAARRARDDRGGADGVPNPARGRRASRRRRRSSRPRLRSGPPPEIGADGAGTPPVHAAAAACELTGPGAMRLMPATARRNWRRSAPQHHGKGDPRMADLIAVVFESEAKAEEVRAKLLAMTKEYLIDIGDAAIAVKTADGKVKLNQLMNMTAAGAAGGSFWGLLIGVLFLNPLLGVAAGAAGGAIGGALTDVGVNDKFMKGLAEADIQPGEAILFVLVKKVTGDKVLDGIKGVGGRILQTSLDHTREERLREALAGQVDRGSGRELRRRRGAGHKWAVDRRREIATSSRVAARKPNMRFGRRAGTTERDRKMKRSHTYWRRSRASPSPAARPGRPPNSAQHEFGCAAGTVSGAVVGGVLGSFVGAGTGQLVATGAGAALGGYAGNRLACG